MAFLKKQSNQLVKSGTEALHSLQTEMNHLFDRVFREGDNMLSQVFAKHSWNPHVDIKETPDTYIVTGDLPGLKKGDVHVTFEHDTLTITGERKYEKHHDDEKHHGLERFHGTFERSFSFPHNQVEEKSISAKIEHGVLTVVLNKVPGAQKSSRKIDVK